MPKFSFCGYANELDDLETELVENEHWTRPQQTTGLLASLGLHRLLKKVRELDPILQDALDPEVATKTDHSQIC